jgi:TatD DNase family protein
MIDIGANLLHPQFDADREAVIERARAAGVNRMLVTATDLSMAEAAIRLCNDEADLFCTAGIHPHDAKDAPVDPEALGEQLRRLARAPAVRAIGETGLDFNRNFSPPEMQRRVFDTQLALAGELGLPVFVHDRDSGGAVYESLARHAANLSGMVVHCFTGSRQDLDRYLALGCAIGITGWICDNKRGASLRELVGRIPLDRLLIETDAPFLLPRNAPRNWQKTNAPGASSRRNEPALLSFVAAGIAEATGTPAAEIIAASSHNARQLFRMT